MTNPIAFILAALVIGLLVFDAVMYSSENLFFLSKRLLDLIEWLAFWR